MHRKYLGMESGKFSSRNSFHCKMKRTEELHSLLHHSNLLVGDEIKEYGGLGNDGNEERQHPRNQER